MTVGAFDLAAKPEEKCGFVEPFPFNATINHPIITGRIWVSGDKFRFQPMAAT